MRKFICVSCGKSAELGWCTNQRGRDMICPDCGGKMIRDDRAGVGGGGRLNQPGIMGAGSGTPGTGFGRGVCDRGSGRGRGRQGNCRRVI
ncbi:hypothetical protein IT084_00515 [Desulfallas sp. Bu1-1]|uniref:hypothetical protein n=1 Tax=Desulfallas sp. Bu1-1 TaxID=2787620 RepID=UPI00189C8DA8|nr:hypothetical protein [Desulfallas sp. Bu1-1]MBF7081464.1 hypothetical protein [Desulfallas sp. Bu1-1]